MGFGLGVYEIAIIAAVVLLLFGPSQLPRLGRSVGQTISEFRQVGKELHGADDEDDEAA